MNILYMLMIVIGFSLRTLHLIILTFHYDRAKQKVSGTNGTDLHNLPDYLNLYLPKTGKKKTKKVKKSL